MAHQSSLGHFVLIYPTSRIYVSLPYLNTIILPCSSFLAQPTVEFLYYCHAYVHHIYSIVVLDLCMVKIQPYLLADIHLYIIYSECPWQGIFLDLLIMSYVIYIVYAKGSKLGTLQFTSRVDDSLYALNNTHIGKSFSKCSLMIVPFVIHDMQYLQEY